MVTSPDSNAPRAPPPPAAAGGARAGDVIRSSNNKNTTTTTKQYDVFYKGELGKLTLTDKVFHYQSYDVSKPTAPLSVKCSWARVEKRQLSPPGALQPMIKLVLVSGRTAVFEVDELSHLIELVHHVKVRMDNVAARKQQQQKAAPRPQATGTANGETNDNNNGKQKRDIEQALPKRKPNITSATASLSQQRRSSSTVSQSAKPMLPPRSYDDSSSSQQEGNTNNNRNKKKKPNESSSDPCGCAAGLWCWLCLCMTIVALALAGVVVYLVFFYNGNNDDNKNSSSNGAYTAYNVRPPPSPPEGCDGIQEQQDVTTNNNNNCPPDIGFEARYGIRAVDYIWLPEFFSFHYIISDYILDTSVDFVVYNGLDCSAKNDNKVIPKDDYNAWIKVDLVDGAPTDGGANLYNEGKGQRQFDINLRLRSNITASPFLVPETTTTTTTMGSSSNTMAWVQLCVGFIIYYNQVNDYTGKVEINYIENAVELYVDTQNATTIRDVQVTTVTRPAYGR